MTEPGAPPSSCLQPIAPTGEAVPVTVQWRGRQPPGPDRPSRRAALRQELESALSGHPGVNVDWSTVSLSAQTVEGEIPADRLAAMVQQLEADGLRVDLVVDRQIVD